MALDYGIVQKYDTKRGTGFVERTIQTDIHGLDEVVFHISKIKEGYPSAAHQLKSGNHSGISFWFETENTKKGERVSQVWLIADDIPSSQRDSFLTMIQSHWQDIDKPLPDWLGKITYQFVGNIGLDKLSQKRKCLLHEHQKIEAERKRLVEEEQRQAEEVAAQVRLAVIQQPERPLIALQKVHPNRLDYWNGIYMNAVNNCVLNFTEFQMQTDHGKSPLGPTELDPYIAYYGGHHYYKLCKAFTAPHFEELRHRTLETYDWGCGQAIATCVFIDHLLKQNKYPNISRITLIDPSADALQSGYTYLERMLMGNQNLLHHIRRITDSINDVRSNHIIAHGEDVKVHLFSNILDIATVNLQHLHEVICASCPGENWIVCTSPDFRDHDKNGQPKYNAASRIDDFIALFRGRHRLLLDYPERDVPIREDFQERVYRADGQWKMTTITRYERQIRVML